MGLHNVYRSFEQTLSGKYSLLSVKLREAADYVVANPFEVATRSLRAVSKDANLSPATFSRMSAALGYTSYEELRDVLRRSVQERSQSFTNGVDTLQKARETGTDGSLLHRHTDACAANLGALQQVVDTETLETCVERLQHARTVTVIGMMGSTSLAEYLVYMARLVSDRWHVCNGVAGSLGSSLVSLGEQDVLIVITKPPFAAPSIEAAREAHERGAYVVVITDTHVCPALVHASAHFIVPTKSPHFYSSYASTLVLCETMIGMLAARAGPQGRARIAEVEHANRRLNEVWGD